jgi:hypothetical protein
MSNAPYTISTAPDLSSLGVLKDNLYYRGDEVQMVDVEAQSNLGKYRKSLTSRSFGSVGEALLPNLDFVGNTFLHLVLAPILNDQCLCANWGNAIISSINYQLGSSNISLVERRGETHWHEQFISCETKEKRDRWGTLGGTAVDAATPHETVDQHAIVHLRLPFSTIAYAMKKSYDTSLLNSPVLIQIHFHPITRILSVQNDAAVGPQPLPFQFKTADLIVRQDVLTNKRDSMKQTLMQGGENLFSPFPFVHSLTGTTRTINDHPINTPINIDLTGFLNSDLLSIAWHITPTKYLNSIIDVAAPGNNKPANPWSTTRCRDIKLIFNGSIIHDMPALLHDAEGIASSKGDVDATNTLILDNGTFGSTAQAGNQFVYYLPFTAGNSMVYKTTSFPNTPRYAQQPLTLSFTPTNTAPESYAFYSTYSYNGVVLTSKGSSNIFFT